MKRSAQAAALVALISICAGFTIGLTYAPCYASLCSETYLPYETRVHIASFYALLASTGCVLVVRALSPNANRLSNLYMTTKEVPVLDKRVTVGGLALALWIVGVTLATTAFWVGPLLDYWGQRTRPLDWATAQVRLAVTGIIGHHADILLGLVILPVSRNSLLGSVFRLHQSTLLYAHKMIAYVVFVAAFAHGAAYYTFVGAYRPAVAESKRAFNIDNPTQTMAEAESHSGWYYATLPSGMLGFLLMLVIIGTSLPPLRRRSYNTFYYCHVVCSIWILIALSVHASTDFYFLLPGLVLWVADWAWRLFRGGGGGLSKEATATVQNAGNGWYRISLTGHLADSDVDGAVDRYDLDAVEKQPQPVNTGGSTNHPIQSYNLVIPQISTLQNHAFTAAKIGNDVSGPVFLLQRAGQERDKEWTWKLGALVPTPGDTCSDVALRVEGPYVPAAAGGGFATARRVVCVVGGTGLTGACSLAAWWMQRRSGRGDARFDLVWTVRDRATAEVREWRELEDMARSCGGMRLRLHVSSEDGRVDVAGWLRETLLSSDTTERCAIGQGGAGGRAWAYVSGPEGLLRSAESACLQVRREVRRARADASGASRVWDVDEVEWYAAKWEV